MVFLVSYRTVGTLKFGVIHHLGISMTLYPEIVPKKVLSGTQKSLGIVKTQQQNMI